MHGDGLLKIEWYVFGYVQKSWSILSTPQRNSHSYVFNPVGYTNSQTATQPVSPQTVQCSKYILKVAKTYCFPSLSYSSAFHYTQSHDSRKVVTFCRRLLLNTWCHTRRNQISSFGETDESIWIGGGFQFSRLLAAEVRALAVIMLDTPCSEVVWRVLATHSISQLPLHFPSCASPCAITFQLESICNVGAAEAVLWYPRYSNESTVL